jgi:hypothetical protein
MIPIIVLSFLNFMISNGLSTLALQYKISAGLGAIIGAIFPLWLVVIGLFASKGKMPVMALVGCCLALAAYASSFMITWMNFWIRNSAGHFAFCYCYMDMGHATLFTKRQAVNFNPYFGLGFANGH